MKKLTKLFILMNILLLVCSGCGTCQTEKERLTGTWYRGRDAAETLIFYKNNSYRCGNTCGSYTLLPDNTLKLVPDSSFALKRTAYIYRFTLEGDMLKILNSDFAGVYYKIAPSGAKAP